jgi:hypothetical protein
MANYDTLAAAGIIVKTNPPSQADIDTINGLSSSDVQGLINVFQAVGVPFLTRNCNGAGGSVVPNPSRTLGIVF